MSKLFDKKPLSEEALNARKFKKEYNYQSEEAFKELNKVFQRSLNHSDLKIIAFECSKILNIKLPRESYRRKPSLIKWISENWESISPIISCLELIANDELSKKSNTSNISNISNKDKDNQSQTEETNLSPIEINDHRKEIIETKTIESKTYHPIEFYQNNDFYQFETDQNDMFESDFF